MRAFTVCRSRCAALALIAAAGLTPGLASADGPSPAATPNFIRFGAVHLSLRDSSSPLTNLSLPVVNTPIDDARVDVGNAASAYLSVGRHLGERWSVEALVLAAPFRHEVKLAGSLALGQPLQNLLQGLGFGVTEAATTKQLPPTLILHYHLNDLNDRSAAWRAHVGVGLNYTRFFSTRPTPALERLLGPTQIKLKDSVGPAAFAGLTYALPSRWQAQALLGWAQVRTRATLSSQTGLFGVGEPVTRTLELKLDPIVTALSLGYRF
jgi:outer membrane protein W